MASEDPANMFADMKKKKKKPKVAFNEETQVADVESKEPIDDPSLGPATAHERALQSQGGGDEAGGEDDVKAMFGDLKKKKKKKEIPADLDGEAAAPAGGDNFSDMKKKKKKKEIPLEGDEAPAAEDGAPVDDFSDLKKKKKKAKAEIPLDLEEGEAPADDFSDLKKKKKKTKTDIPMDLEATADAGEGDEFGELKKRKKKKAYAMDEFAKEMGDEEEAPAPKPKKAPKKVTIADSDEEDGDDDDDGQFDDFGIEDDDDDLGENPFDFGGGGGGRDESEAWLGSDRDYTYEELLSRFFRVLHAANPSLASSSGKRYTLAPPQIHREGNKKSVFANIVDICRRMHREPTHVISFLLVEMGTTGSTDGAGRLVIKGKFQQKQIENILRRYIMEYVTCKTCKSPDTILTRETRISFMTCSSCGSRQSVAPIKAGFQAQVGKRKKAQV